MYQPRLQGILSPGRFSCLLLALLLAQPFSPLSAAGDASDMSFADFKRVNQENYSLVRTGRLTMQHKEYQYEPPELLKMQAESEERDFERIREYIMQNPAIPESQRSGIAANAKRNQPYRRKLESGTIESEFEVVRQFTFDFSLNKYRLDEGPAATGARNDRASLVRVISEGNALEYNKDVDQAVVYYFKSPTPRDLPAHLGTIQPSYINDPDLSVTIATGAVDGHQTTVYRLRKDGDEIVIYVDPALGFRYRRIEFFSGERLTRTMAAQDYKLFDGVPFPTRHEDKRLADDPAGRLLKSESILVHEAEFNKPLDPDIFKIAFTSNTIVMDTILGFRYKVFEGVDRESLVAPMTMEDIVEKGIGLRAQDALVDDVRQADRQGAEVADAGAQGVLDAGPEWEAARRTPAKTSVGNGLPLRRLALSMIVLAMVVWYLKGVLNKSRKGGSTPC